jgi:antitoxin YefM
MKTATVTEFRTNAKELLEQVEKDQDILILSRPKNQEGFVVLTMSHYEALEETAHLLSTQANTEHLMASIAQHKAGRTTQRRLVESKRPRKLISKK